MAVRRSDDHGSNAVAVLATALVVLGGAAGFAVVVVAGATDPGTVLAVTFGSVAGMVFLGWLLRDKKLGGLKERYFWLRRRKAPKVKVVIGRQAAVVPETPPAPPTVQTVRELADGNHTWVPTGTPPRRRDKLR